MTESSPKFHPLDSMNAKMNRLPTTLVMPRAKLVVPGGHSILGITSHAMPDSVPTCGGTSDSPGLWYSVMGSNARIVVLTCGSHTTFDTKISV
jgi:hypothetical protein